MGVRLDHALKKRLDEVRELAPVYRLGAVGVLHAHAEDINEEPARQDGAARVSHHENPNQAGLAGLRLR
jgi:hypothetical protein